MDIIIERPTLNKDTSRRNLAVVDSWIADTADKLNAFFTAYKKSGGTVTQEATSTRSAEIFIGATVKETEVITLEAV